jgi:WhiB family transcriptional regulator, redox-sensing transcriptional regulator
MRLSGARATGRPKRAPNKIRVTGQAPDFGRGACADHPSLAPEVWTDPAKEDSAIAIRVCERECPVRAACLAWAIRNKETEGIWGGKTPAMRLHPEVRRRALSCNVEHVR